MQCIWNGLTLRFEAGKDKNQIVVEIWKLIQLLQFLFDLLKHVTQVPHIFLLW